MACLQGYCCVVLQPAKLFSMSGVEFHALKMACRVSTGEEHTYTRKQFVRFSVQVDFAAVPNISEVLLKSFQWPFRSLQIVSVPGRQ